MSNYVTSLNNLLQDKQQTHLIAWSEKSSGPSHAPTWTVECRGGELKGTGSGVSKADAKQLAAKEALASLRG
ncbi:hypothetical protein HYPSUDRAFT_197436 [Hypholoma sublateritium FD-334 SS-4]|uniref:DRBM domain-containing protein n=1 Tax=Hypholoma sublateritium (strain FD-334 SS-4) TaxID=945553 RepID=A0A0D2QAF8_HYPSF|nr:hypothetical protein HYPSUDRAFT_197436 [Hypholoma sublateritium FD-334 SS-4]